MMMGEKEKKYGLCLDGRSSEGTDNHTGPVIVSLPSPPSSRRISGSLRQTHSVVADSESRRPGDDRHGGSGYS